MSPKELLQEIHKRSIGQVLAVYLASAAVGYQLIEAVLSVPSPRSAAQLGADPLFKLLHDDPRFQALLQRHAR